MAMATMVIGGNGYVGSHVLRQLVDKGETPICYDIAPPSPLWADMADKIQMVHADVLNATDLIRTIKELDVDRIVLLTSLVTFASQRNPVKAYQLNIGSTLNVLEAARVIPLKRIVYASSLAVYGRTPENMPLPESTARLPVSLYGSTKVFCEDLGVAYHQNYGVDFCAIRFPGMWGPGQGLIMTGKSTIYGSGKFAELVENPARGQKALLPGIKQRYELLYIKDARDLVYRLLLADTLKHRIYNAGSEAMCSLQEVAGWLRSLLPAAEIEFDESVEFPEGYDFAMPCGNHLDITRAKKELGYFPRYKPPEALKDYLRYLGHRV
jgi:nucleoside-diphosphate-sugar epimerase